ncbi:unnamed protein product [Calicophoron daubneyi]|uniref:Uncharacterized protein n=1 Tax=Calicophoron daubneyi TaxID=300641 RepID=A0AAV2TL42_CALDB
MEPIYSAARSIVDHTQPSLDGGFIAFALNNLIHIPSTYHKPLLVNSTEPTVTDHIQSTFARTGYALAITFGLIWVLVLLVAAIYVCRQRNRYKRRLTGTICVAGVNTNSVDGTTAISPLKFRPASSSICRVRDRFQSNWVCLLVQFSVLSILAVLLATGVLLGFAISSQLHANLAAPATHEESVGRLLTPAELNHTNPPPTNVFPRILRGLAQIRAYLSEFVYHTKNDTESVVRELIKATEKMQDDMTADFNALLFEKIGVTEAFALGDELGASVISLINHSMAVVELDNAFKDRFDRFKVELQTWLRLINTYVPNADEICTDRCKELRATFSSNLTTRPDTFMPHFNFAIALKFVTTDQNQTAESVQQQLSSGKVLAAKQLAETKKIMAEKINIPKSIRDMTNEQWDVVGSQLTDAITTIDEQAGLLTRSAAPKVSAASSIFLAIGCIFWILLLFLTIGVTWLIIHYHCVPSELSVRSRGRVRAAAGCGFVILSVTMLFAVVFFLAGGYAFTEACRYIQPTQKRITVVEHDGAEGEYSQVHMFPLDAHINLFLDKHWQEITALAAKATPNGSRPVPIPHIRSPIYAILHNCRENMGILDAMDAIHSFDAKSMNDPKISERFVELGREIMLDSLKAIDVDEMFPKETDAQLAMAGQLDNFFVDFESHRRKLPSTYVSVRPPDDESGNYILFSLDDMWRTYDAYHSEVLRYRLSSENITRLRTATQQVRSTLLRLDIIIMDIAQHLTELGKAQKVSPLVTKLDARLKQLKALMSNKPALINLAVKLFDENIKTKTPAESEKLIVRFAPKLMARVGRCRRLYEAGRDFNTAICGGVVDILNSFWFVTGWVGLTGTVAIVFSLLLLIHKPEVETSGRPSFFKVANPGFGVYDRRSVSANSSGRFLPNEAELEQLNPADNSLPLPKVSVKTED